MRVDLEARDLVWVTVTDVDGNTLIARTLQPNETRTLELTKGATLRTGNAGGLAVRFNGQDVGPLGPSRQSSRRAFQSRRIQDRRSARRGLKSSRQRLNRGGPVLQ